MEIYCCGCAQKVEARLTDGVETYPHRKDLAGMPFWKCDTCGNFVGCHHKTKNRTRPLGCIPTPELKNARGHIHRILDPLWQQYGFDRKKVYEYLSEKSGRQYHTANIRTLDEARQIYRWIQELGKTRPEGRKDGTPNQRGLLGD